MSSMTWKSAFDAATFELPEPSPEDLAALERADQHHSMDSHEYLAFLVRFTKDLPPSGAPDGPWPEPFEL